jgi:hypothetical protein
MLKFGSNDDLGVGSLMSPFRLNACPAGTEITVAMGPPAGTVVA